MAIKGELKQISDQYQDYLLCEKCEERFSRLGEKWVLANLPAAYGAEFPLHRILEPITPKIVAPRLNIYDLSKVEGFGMEKIIYFGISIFWRGAVHRWKTASGFEAPRVDLGKYEEPIRRFLLSAEPLPGEIVMTIDLWPYKPVLPLVHPAMQDHGNGFSRYWFYVPGLHFFLFAGSRIPSDARASDSAAGIVTLDRDTADSLLSFTVSGIKSQIQGPKIKTMFKEIETVRARKKVPQSY